MCRFTYPQPAGAVIVFTFLSYYLCVQFETDKICKVSKNFSDSSIHKILMESFVCLVDLFTALDVKYI